MNILGTALIVAVTVFGIGAGCGYLLYKVDDYLHKRVGTNGAFLGFSILCILGFTALFWAKINAEEVDKEKEKGQQVCERLCG